MSDCRWPLTAGSHSFPSLQQRQPWCCPPQSPLAEQQLLPPADGDHYEDIASEVSSEPITVIDGKVVL